MKNLSLENTLQYSLYLSATVLLAVVCCKASADWRDSLNEGYNILFQTLQGEPKPKPESADVKGSPQEVDTINTLKKIPAHWVVSVENEPVFNSQLYIVEAGKQNQQTVVLIHGLGQNGFRDWLNVIPELEKNYHVLTVDLPGFGRSSVPAGRYSPRNYARVIHWLVSRFSKGQVIVVGHSMGGAVALRYSSQYPTQVKKLILVDAAGILERTAFAKHSAELPIDVNQVPNVLKRITAQIKDFGGSLVELATVIPDVTKVIDSSDLIWNKTFSGRPNLNAAMALVNEDFSQAIKTLPHETAIIWGRHDNVTPLRTGQMLVGRLPNASLSVIETSKHVPMSSDPEEFNQLLLSAITSPQVKSTNPVTYRSKGKLMCKNKNGVSYTGRYDNVIIKNCTGITLNNIQAKQLTITDSIVALLNTDLDTDKIALQVNHSVVVATNSTFRGQLGIFAEDSRLDLAGVSIVGEENSVEIGKRSRFIFSVSDLSSETYRGYVHGVYRYNHTSLDVKLVDR